MLKMIVKKLRQQFAEKENEEKEDNSLLTEGNEKEENDDEISQDITETDETVLLLQNDKSHNHMIQQQTTVQVRTMLKPVTDISDEKLNFLWRYHGRSDFFGRFVLGSSKSLDITLLTIADLDIFSIIKPLPFNEPPYVIVLVIGFAIGGIFEPLLSYYPNKNKKFLPISNGIFQAIENLLLKLLTVSTVFCGSVETLNLKNQYLPDKDCILSKKHIILIIVAVISPVSMLAGYMEFSKYVTKKKLSKIGLFIKKYPSLKYYTILSSGMNTALAVMSLVATISVIMEINFKQSIPLVYELVPTAIFSLIAVVNEFQNHRNPNSIRVRQLKKAIYFFNEFTRPTLGNYYASVYLVFTIFPLLLGTSQSQLEGTSLIVAKLIACSGALLFNMNRARYAYWYEFTMKNDYDRMSLQIDQTIKDNIPSLNFRQSLRLGIEVLKNELPFAVAVTAAGNTLFTSLLLAEIGPEAVAAGVFITTLQNFCMGTSTASLSSIGLLIGSLNKQMKNRSSQIDTENQTADHYLKIGQVIRQGWIYASLLTVGSIAILMSGEPMLKAVGISSTTARMTQDYLNWYMIGIWPLLQAHADQQLSIGTKSPWVPLFQGPFYAAIAFTLSLLASRGYTGDYFTGIKGIGFGTALAGWFIFFGTKLTHLLKSNRQYSLYRCDFRGGTKVLKELVSVGAKSGLQVASEWGHLLGTAMLIGQFGNDSLRSIQPSVQLITMINLFCLGYSVAAGALLTNYMQQFKTIQRDERLKKEWNRDLIERGNLSILTGMILPVTVAIAVMAAPQIFTKSLLPKSVSEAELQLANTFLRINNIGIVLDSFRIISTGPLRSFQDFNYTTFVNFLMMSLIGLFAEGMSTLMGDAGLETFFWIRNLTILMATMLVLYRWLDYQKASPEDKIALAEIHREHGQKPAVIFKPFKVLTLFNSVGNDNSIKSTVSDKSSISSAIQRDKKKSSNSDLRFFKEESEQQKEKENDLLLASSSQRRPRHGKWSCALV